MWKCPTKTATISTTRAPKPAKQYPIYCRKKGSLDARRRSARWMQMNSPRGRNSCPCGHFEVSDDGNLLAYTTDNTGFRQYVLAVKDLRTGKMLPDHAERVGSVMWANDNKTIFYTVEDATTKRDNQVFPPHRRDHRPRHSDLRRKRRTIRRVSRTKSRSKAYIFLFSGSHTTTEARYIPADQPNAEWKVLEPRKQDVEYYPRTQRRLFLHPRE